MKKYLSIALALIMFVVPVYYMVNHQTDMAGSLLTLALFTLLPIFIFNLIARNYLLFKPYFTSPINILIEYQKETFQYELSKDLMIPKLVESVEGSHLKLKQIDKQQGALLATSAMSWTSWGENVYITLNQKGIHTEVTLEMTTISQFSSWGRNGTHYKNILNQFEESLVI